MVGKVGLIAVGLASFLLGGVVTKLILYSPRPISVEELVESSSAENREYSNSFYLEEEEDVSTAEEERWLRHLKEERELMQDRQSPVYDKTEVPRFKYAVSQSVVFTDNFAPGMRAFVRYDDSEEEELGRIIGSIDKMHFLIPESYFEKDRKIYVRAEDRDGNSSIDQALYTVDGMVIHEPTP